MSPQTDSADSDAAVGDAVSGPVLRVVGGGVPTAEQVAALSVVLLARAAVAREAAQAPTPLRRPLSRWVTSGLMKGTRTRA